MKRSRFSEEQIISVLKEHEAGMKTADVCCKHGISDATLYKWKARYGGMTASETARLRMLEEENRRVKKPLGEQMVAKGVLKEPLGKKLARPGRGWGRGSAGVPINAPWGAGPAG